MASRSQLAVVPFQPHWMWRQLNQRQSITTITPLTVRTPVLCILQSATHTYPVSSDDSPVVVDFPRRPYNGPESRPYYLDGRAKRRYSS
jgi:hypothetical protein